MIKIISRTIKKKCETIFSDTVKSSSSKLAGLSAKSSKNKKLKKRYGPRKLPSDTKIAPDIFTHNFSEYTQCFTFFSQVIQ